MATVDHRDGRSAHWGYRQVLVGSRAINRQERLRSNAYKARHLVREGCHSRWVNNGASERLGGKRDSSLADRPHGDLP